MLFKSFLKRVVSLQMQLQRKRFFGKILKGARVTADSEFKPKYEFKGADLVMPEGGNASFWCKAAELS